MIGAIAGEIAQAFYKKLPPGIVADVRSKLPRKLLAEVDRFNRRYGGEF